MMTLTTTNSSETMLRPSAVAATLGISSQTLVNWRKKGTGPAFVKQGSYLRYPSSGILEFLGNRAPTAAPNAKPAPVAALVLDPPVEVVIPDFKEDWDALIALQAPVQLVQDLPSPNAV